MKDHRDLSERHPLRKKTEDTIVRQVLEQCVGGNIAPQEAINLERKRNSSNHRLGQGKKWISGAMTHNGLKKDSSSCYLYKKGGDNLKLNCQN